MPNINRFVNAWIGDFPKRDLALGSRDLNSFLLPSKTERAFTPSRRKFSPKKISFRSICFTRGWESENHLICPFSIDETGGLFAPNTVYGMFDL